MNQAPQALRLSVTRWTNPSKKDRVTVDLYTGTGIAKVDRHRNASGYTRVVWEPGQTIELSSDFDQAIQKLDANGQVVGGRAPQLLRNGQRHQVHPALDVFRSNAETAEEALLDAAKQNAEMRERLSRAEQQATEARERAEAAALAEAQAVEAAKQRELIEQQLELQRQETERLRQELEALKSQAATGEASGDASQPPARKKGSK